jgi:UDP-N-acetyl-D-galactosamine dehydrogenase
MVQVTGLYRLRVRFMQEKIGVIGLGYVGLPLALAFARKFDSVVGFDIDKARIARLLKGEDVTDEGLDEQIRSTSLLMTSDPALLKSCTFFIVGVPTPIDVNNNPDLGPLNSACDIVGKVLSKGAVVVFESTVYPGVTEEICGPRLAACSGLKAFEDFKLGYSPERINPGDKEHALERVIKVVSGQDAQTLKRVADVYRQVVEVGVHQAPSIKVAEAAKVIENTQRDLNIALMNELAIIFDKLNIRTKDVLDAAATKWNFIRFAPGLVGGHCIGVDPYYLTTKAEQLGYHPQVILAGRRINDEMGSWLAQRMIKLMVNAGLAIKGARVGILGVTFKENVSDVRNSRIPDIYRELADFGVQPLLHDPLADPHQIHEEYGIELCSWESMKNLDGLVFAVPHKSYMDMGPKQICSLMNPNGIFVDVKSVFANALKDMTGYWSL